MFWELENQIIHELQVIYINLYKVRSTTNIPKVKWSLFKRKESASSSFIICRLNLFIGGSGEKIYKKNFRYLTIKKPVD